MGPEVSEDFREEGPSDRPDERPVGSDYEVDPFLARRAPEGGADDVFDGDW